MTNGEKLKELLSDISDENLEKMAEYFCTFGWVDCDGDPNFNNFVGRFDRSQLLSKSPQVWIATEYEENPMPVIHEGMILWVYTKEPSGFILDDCGIIFEDNVIWINQKLQSLQEVLNNDNICIYEIHNNKKGFKFDSETLIWHNKNLSKMIKWNCDSISMCGDAIKATQGGT